jgi:hypothetical protein
MAAKKFAQWLTTIFGRCAVIIQTQRLAQALA